MCGQSSFEIITSKLLHTVRCEGNVGTMITLSFRYCFTELIMLTTVVNIYRYFSSVNVGNAILSFKASS